MRSLNAKGIIVPAQTNLICFSGTVSRGIVSRVVAEFDYVTIPLIVRMVPSIIKMYYCCSKRAWISLVGYKRVIFKEYKHFNVRLNTEKSCRSLLKKPLGSQYMMF